MRGSVSQELSRIWIQENVDPTVKKQPGWTRVNCAQQVLCAVLFAAFEYKFLFRNLKVTLWYMFKLE